jgi:hypothetical protein
MLGAAAAAPALLLTLGATVAMPELLSMPAETLAGALELTLEVAEAEAVEPAASECAPASGHNTSY